MKQLQAITDRPVVFAAISDSTYGPSGLVANPAGFIVRAAVNDPIVLWINPEECESRAVLRHPRRFLESRARH
jgi:hypothetical protein